MCVGVCGGGQLEVSVHVCGCVWGRTAKGECVRG